jgi:hypothetical protein
MSRFDEDLRRAIRSFVSEPLPPNVLDEAFDEPPPSQRWLLVAAGAGVLVLAVSVGLGIGRLVPVSPSAEASASIAASPSDGGAPGCENLAPPAGGNDIVLVFFPCGADLEPVSTIRPIEFGAITQDRLDLALRALLDGPHDWERDAGLSPAVPDGSSNLLADLEVTDDGLAIVDFAPELGQVPNLSTSAASGAFLRSVRETALQFDNVTAVELRLGGSCQALFEHLQSECQHLAKPVEPVSDCPIIEPAVLPSGLPITAPRAYPGEPMVTWGSGQDTVTQLPGIRPSGGVVDGTQVDVRGQPGFVRPAGDLPLPQPFEIVWDEDGCRYVVFVALAGGLDATLDFARRYGTGVAEPSPTPRAMLPATVEAEGIRLTLAIDRGTTSFRQRVTATVTIENIGVDSVFWGHSGTCVFPASIIVYPEVRERLRHGRTDWPGDVGILKSVTVDERLSTVDLTHAFSPEGWLDFEGNMGCTSDLRISELPAGGTLVQLLEWDAYGYYGMPAEPGVHTLEATFSFMSRGMPPTGDEEVDSFSVRAGLALTVEGADVEYVHPGEAVDALLEDSAYRGLLADAPRGLWIESDLDFIDDRWEAVLYLSASDTEVEPVRALVGVVDARTGEVLDASFEQRTRPGDG